MSAELSGAEPGKYTRVMCTFAPQQEKAFAFTLFASSSSVKVEPLNGDSPLQLLELPEAHAELGLGLAERDHPVPPPRQIPRSAPDIRVFIGEIYQ